MDPDRSVRDRLRLNAIALAHALVYAVTLTATVTLGMVALGIASGGGFVRGKRLLFVAGWVLMAYATVRLWPSKPSDIEMTRAGDTSGTKDAGSIDPTGETIPAIQARSRFQRFVYALPPIRWLPIPPYERRFTDEAKVFLASLLVLAASYVMETVFGVA